MSLWKRTLSGAAVVVGAGLAVTIGSLLPPGVIPPVSTVVAIFVIPVLVGGGASVIRIRSEMLARQASGRQQASSPQRSGNPSGRGAGPAVGERRRIEMHPIP